jgi:hypothetical protein
LDEGWQGRLGRGDFFSDNVSGVPQYGYGSIDIGSFAHE